jgi:hypothetical protein
MNLNVQLKMIAFSAIAVLLFVSMSYLNQNVADATSVNVSLSQTQSMRLIRMDLQGLQEDKIDTAHEALRQLPGVAQIELDPSHREVTLWVDIERTNLKTIERSLHTAGFTPIYH